MPDYHWRNCLRTRLGCVRISNNGTFMMQEREERKLKMKRQREEEESKSRSVKVSRPSPAPTAHTSLERLKAVGPLPEGGTTLLCS